jgi:transcriptional regulator with XRE-family HTH domain
LAVEALKTAKETAMSVFSPSLGEAIKEARIGRFGLRELAREIDISPTYLSRLENGFEVRPSDAIINRLAETLGLSETELYIKAGRLPRKVLDHISTDRAMLATIINMVEGEG